MSMTAPAEEPLEGNLGAATDEEWLQAHENLVELLRETDVDEADLTFIWDPELDPKTLIDDDEVDYGPAKEDS